MPPQMPLWLQVALAILVPIETGLLTVAVLMLRALRNINGTVKEHSAWIMFHEKWTKELSDGLRKEIDGIEDRERHRRD